VREHCQLVAKRSVPVYRSKSTTLDKPEQQIQDILAVVSLDFVSKSVEFVSSGPGKADPGGCEV
jgi:hypothetical protein